MSRSRQVVSLVLALGGVLLGVGLAVDSARDAAARWQVRDGPVLPGVVVERYRGYKAWFPSVTVAYEVDGRRYERDLRGHLDLDERVEVQVLPDDPQVSRVLGEGGAALVLDGLCGVGLVVLAAVEAQRSSRALRRAPAAPPDRPVPEPERPGDRDEWRERVWRAAAAGAAGGALLWGVLALLLGPGPPREVATALLGTVGSGTALGALVGLLRSRGALVRTGRRGAWRLGVAGLLAAVPLVLAVAAALEA